MEELTLARLPISPRLGGRGPRASDVARLDHLLNGSVKIRVCDAGAPASETADLDHVITLPHFQEGGQPTPG